MNNDDHHASIYLQLKITTRYLEQNMTLYECLWRCTRMCNDLAWQRYQKRTSHKNIMLAILRSCKAIWQWMLKSCIWWWWKLHGNISRNGYGNAIIGRYGGCFEEGYKVGLMHRRKLRGTRVASKGGRVRVRIIHGLNISHKGLTYLLQKSTSHQKPSTTGMLLGG